MFVWSSFSRTSFPSASSHKAKRISETSESCNTVCTLFQKSSRTPGDSIVVPWALSGGVEHFASISAGSISGFLLELL